MNMNPGMVVPLGSKKLDDLTRNTPEVNKLFTAILNAVQVVGTNKVTGRKQGVSFLHLSALLPTLYCY
jgi:hypothetical protein